MAVAAGKDLGSGLQLAAVAAGVIGTTAIIDLVTVERAARRHAGRQWAMAFSVLPLLDARAKTGLQVAARIALGRW